jgi:hypothetical protein
MGLESALVLPTFQNDKPVVPADLAEHLHILAAIVFATCCGLGFERSDRRFHRLRHDLDIGRHANGGILRDRRRAHETRWPRLPFRKICSPTFCG